MSNPFEIWKGLYHFLIACIMPLTYLSIWVYFVNSLSILLTLNKTIHFAFAEKGKYFLFHYSLPLEREVVMAARDVSRRQVMPKQKPVRLDSSVMFYFQRDRGLEEFLIEISCTPSYHQLLGYSPLSSPKAAISLSFKQLSYSIILVTSALSHLPVRSCYSFYSVHST